MSLSDIVAGNPKLSYALVAAAAFVAFLLLMFRQKGRFCFGELCSSFGDAPIKSVLLVVLLIVCFLVGLWLAGKILVFLFTHTNPYLWVGIFIVLMGVLLTLIPTIKRTPGEDFWGFFGIAVFMWLIGLAMIIFPLIWPQKYGLS